MFYYLLTRDKRKIELVGKATVYPHDNPVWDHEKKQSKEWFVILALTSELAKKMVRSWPLRREDARNGTRIVDYGKRRD